VAGIEQLLEHDLPIRINLRMNVDRTNVDALEAMVDFYQARGWTRHPRITFTAAPVDNRSGSLKDLDSLLGWHELFERLLPLSVDAGTGPFDLSVFKAASYFRSYFHHIAQPNHEKIAFVPKILYCEAAALKLFVFHPDGRIYPCPESVGMERMAIGMYYPGWTMNEANVKQWREQTILQRERCRGCDISTFCGGGCVLYALLQNGSMSQPECENAPEILEAYFRQVSLALA
jgi:uncharacterized protein